MRTRRLVFTLGLLVAACSSGRGGPRPIDPGQLAVEPGWIVAAPTPEIRQRHGFDAGAAALAMVAGRWMIPMTLDEAIAATPVHHDVRVGDLYNAALASGLEARSVSDDPDILEFELRAHRPVIVGLMRTVGKERRRHYEVVVAMRPTTGEVVTIDPDKGWRVRDRSQLDREWRPNSRAALVVVGRTAQSQELRPKPKPPADHNVAERHRPEVWP